MVMNLGGLECIRCFCISNAGRGEDCGGGGWALVVVSGGGGGIFVHVHSPGHHLPHLRFLLVFKD